MFAFIDTETTGLPNAGRQPRIVQLAWLIASSKNKVLLKNSIIIKPNGFEIPREAELIHGISTLSALRNGRELHDVLTIFSTDIKKYKPTTLVAHNLAFDKPIIYEEYKRVNCTNPLIGFSEICTKKLSRRRWPRESARLADVYHRLFGESLEGAHDAATDVQACARIFFALEGTMKGSKPSATGQAPRQSPPGSMRVSPRRVPPPIPVSPSPSRPKVSPVRPPPILIPPPVQPAAPMVPKPEHPQSRPSPSDPSLVPSLRLVCPRCKKVNDVLHQRTFLKCSNCKEWELASRWASPIFPRIGRHSPENERIPTGTAKDTSTAWLVCPVCGRTNELPAKRPYLACPSCGVASEATNWRPGDRPKVEEP